MGSTVLHHSTQQDVFIWHHLMNTGPVRANTLLSLCPGMLPEFIWQTLISFWLFHIINDNKMKIPSVLMVAHHNSRCARSLL